MFDLFFLESNITSPLKNDESTDGERTIMAEPKWSPHKYNTSYESYQCSAALLIKAKLIILVTAA